MCRYISMYITDSLVKSKNRMKQYIPLYSNLEGDIRNVTSLTNYMKLRIISNLRILHCSVQTCNFT